MFDNIAFDTNALVEECVGRPRKKNKGARIGAKQGQNHSLAEYEELASQLYPAQIFAFSGASDDQTAADVADVTSFGLPPVVGAAKAGGAMTNGFHAVLQKHKTTGISFANLLLEVRGFMKEKGYTQVPCLSTGHQVDLKRQNFTLMNPHPNSPDATRPPRRRAVIIGINYIGEGGAQLDGCVTDAKMQYRWLQEEGWAVDNPDEVRYYTDDPKGWTMGEPTAENIINAYKWLVEGAQAGDTLFTHFSGHGAQVVDTDGDELDGYDETIVPLDFRTAGQITDDVIHKLLVTPLPRGVFMVNFWDQCHSGSCEDLPYMFEVNDANQAKLQTAVSQSAAAAMGATDANNNSGDGGGGMGAPQDSTGGGMGGAQPSVSGADADGDALLMQANPEFNFEFAKKLLTQVMDGGFEAMPEVFDTLLKGKEARQRSKKLQSCCLGMCFGGEAGRHDKKKKEMQEKSKAEAAANKNNNSNNNNKNPVAPGAAAATA